MAKYDKLSLDELQKEQHRISDERAKLRAEGLAVVEQIDKRTAERDAESLVEGMSPAQRKALTQVVGAKGFAPD